MAHRLDNDRWDYDCPQFVDFTQPMPFNDGADQMFESAVVGEGRAPHFLSQEEQFTEDTKDASKETSEKPVEQKMEESNTDSKNKPKDSKPSNLITSLAEWKSRGKHASSEQIPFVRREASDSKKPRKSAEKAMKNIQASAPKSALSRSKSVRLPKSGSASALNTGKAAATITNTSGGVATSRPARTRTFSQGRSRSRSNSVDLGTPAEPKVHDTTGGKSAKMPALLKSLGNAVSSSGNKVKSSEQIEMERIKQLQKELQLKRQMAQESYKKAMARTGPVAVHSNKCPTMPQEFRFQTDSRLKTQSEKAEEKSVNDFVKSLRSHTVPAGPSTSGTKKLTVPQPFHLTEKHSSGTQQASAESKFESLAEKVKAFHRQTPERFRVRAKSGDRQAGRAASPLKLTQPHTPHLTAKARHRPVHYMSQEQIEAQEIEEMKRNQFKARPVNTRVLSGSSLGVKKVPARPLTQHEEFALSSGVTKKKEEEEEEEHFEFRARPVNKKILEGTVGVKPVKAPLPTVPMSPAFALKHRVRLPEVSEEKDTSGNVARAKAVPYMGIPFQPKLQHQHTVPEPFAVEERSKTMLMQKEEKIKRVLEEEKKAHEFHAQPLPNLEPDELPEKHPKELTKPEPFRLETDQRGVQYLQEKLVAEEQQQEEMKKAMQFKAKPPNVIYKDPFIPAKSTKALTEVSDFELNSDRRAVEREEFEMWKKEREAELEGHRRQREQRQKEEEEAAILKLRAEMVHRPNPVRHYNPVHIKPSDKPLTEAESPRFSDRLRAKVRI